MKIVSAGIALQGEHSARQYHRSAESLQVSLPGGARAADPAVTRRSEPLLDAEFGSYRALASSRGTAGSRPFGVQGPLPETPVADGIQSSGTETGARVDRRLEQFFTDFELRLIELLFEKLTGREFEVVRVDVDPAASGADTAPPEPAAAFSVRYVFSEVYREEESTRFVAAGSVLTAAGVEIAFRLDMQMQRSFESSRHVEVLIGERKDPLLINLGKGAAELSTRKFAFDLDADGTPERIAFATGASAFIALDRDADGRISSGRELFGAESGDGFRELAAYDVDGNGFIDAGDPVFSRLLAYSKDENGADRLASLGSLGVGALYLGRAVTPFEIRDDANEPLAGVRYSGLFLYEDHQVGSLQQVDLVV